MMAFRMRAEQWMEPHAAAVLAAQQRRVGAELGQAPHEPGLDARKDAETAVAAFDLAEITADVGDREHLVEIDRLRVGCRRRPRERGEAERARHRDLATARCDDGLT